MSCGPERAAEPDTVQSVRQVAVATITISGRMLGAMGVAVPGVTVHLDGSSQSVTTTDASGNYAFSGLSAGSYSVRPTLANCAFNPDVANLNNLSSNVIQNFTGSGSACGGPVQNSTTTGPLMISGFVLDATGTAIAGQIVQLNGSAQAVQATDSSGQYMFKVNPGSYSVSATKSGCTFMPGVVNLNNLNHSTTQDFLGSGPSCGGGFT